MSMISTPETIQRRDLGFTLQAYGHPITAEMNAAIH